MSKDPIKLFLMDIAENKQISEKLCTSEEFIGWLMIEMTKEPIMDERLMDVLQVQLRDLATAFDSAFLLPRLVWMQRLTILLLMRGFLTVNPGRGKSSRPSIMDIASSLFKYPSG